MTQGKRRLVTEAGRANPVLPVHIWTPLGRPGGNLVVVAHLDVYATMHQHAVSSLPDETGGFLLGRVAFDAEGRTWLVEIDEALPVEPGSQNPVHFSFDWRDVDRVRTYRQERDKALVGWYHTHPNLPIFLSDTDLDRAHRVLFAEPFQLALVYDPVRGRAGYFYWEAPQTIDAAPADWREFAIAVQEGVPRAEPEAQARTAAAAPLATAPPAGATEASVEEPEPGDAAMTVIGAPRPSEDAADEAASVTPRTPPMGTPVAVAANAMARAAADGTAIVAAPPRAPVTPEPDVLAPAPKTATPARPADEPRTMMMPPAHYATPAHPVAAPAPAPAPVGPLPASLVAAPPPPRRSLLMVLLVIALVSLGFSAGIVAMILLGKIRFF